MYARTVNARAQPGRLRELLTTIRASVEPSVGTRPGLRHVLFLVDRDAERILTVTLWDTEADAREVDTSDDAEEQFLRVQTLLSGSPIVTFYEVAE